MAKIEIEDDGSLEDLGSALERWNDADEGDAQAERDLANAAWAVLRSAGRLA